MLHCYLLIFSFLFPLIEGDCDSQDKNRSIFLWSIKKEEIGATGYLFGTIHVPYTEVWDRVSDRVREAFAASDTVLLEVDLNNEETLRKLVRCKKLPRKQTALSYLPPELFAKIKTFMSKFRQQLVHASASHPMITEDTVQHVQQIFDNLAGNWHRKRPEWLLFTLYQLCENLLDRSTAPMLDVYLATKALEKEKRLEAIETAEEQCNPVSNIPLDDIVFSIGYTLHFLEKMYFGSGFKKERSLSELIENYRCGSLESQLMNSSDYDQKLPGIPFQEKERARNIDLNLKEDIITKRNVRMAKRIDQMINDYPQRVIFTAIGTGHFLGEQSILQHLFQLGYRIEPLKNDDTISSRRKAKVKSLWTRDFVPKPPLVVIEYINSTASYGLLRHLIYVLLLRLLI